MTAIHDHVLEVAAPVGRLDPGAQRAFRIAGTLDTPDFTAWVVAAALDTPLEEAAHQLETLSTTGLLEPTEVAGRYRLHDLLRLYARELAREHDDDGARYAAVARILQCCAGLAKVAGRLLPGGVRGLGPPSRSWGEVPEDLVRAPEAWLALEKANLLAVLKQACRCGAADEAASLALGLMAFFELGSRYDSWRSAAAAAAAPWTADRNTAFSTKSEWPHTTLTYGTTAASHPGRR